MHFHVHQRSLVNAIARGDGRVQYTVILNTVPSKPRLAKINSFVQAAELKKLL